MRLSVKKDTEPEEPVATDDAKAQLIHSPHKETPIWLSEQDNASNAPHTFIHVIFTIPPVTRVLIFRGSTRGAKVFLQ